MYPLFFNSTLRSLWDTYYCCRRNCRTVEISDMKAGRPLKVNYLAQDIIWCPSPQHIKAVDVTQCVHSMPNGSSQIIVQMGGKNYNLIIESTYRRGYAQRRWDDGEVTITQTKSNYSDPLPYISPNPRSIFGCVYSASLGALS